MEELLNGARDNPECCPDFWLLTPGEVAERGFVVYRLPNGDWMISEGAFIQIVGQEDGERPDYRVQTDEGNVMRIVAFVSDEDILLGSQSGGQIVVEYHQTKAWAQDTDSSDLRFRKVGQPVTPNSVAPIVAPPADLPGSKEVPEKGPLPQALVLEPWVTESGEATEPPGVGKIQPLLDAGLLEIRRNTTGEEVFVKSVAENTATPAMEEPVVEVEEEIEQALTIRVQSVDEDKLYRIERDENSGEVVLVVEEISGDTIPFDTKRVRNIISEAEDTVWWTKFPNTSRLRFRRLQEPVPA